MDVTPLVEGGAFPVKAAVGEPFEVSALVFREGHDEHCADVVLIDPDGGRRRPVRMRRSSPEPDRWAATVACDEVGPWGFEIESWDDPLSTWLHHAEVKVPAGVDVELVFLEGSLLVERVLAEHEVTADAAKVLKAALTALKDRRRPDEARLAASTSDEVRELFACYPLRDLLTTTGPHPVFCDRREALFSSWYEVFPRSEGAVRREDGTIESGTFATAAKRLDAVAAMGFDVLYLPPIHPIGEVNRKGRNNTLDPGPEDVGSPWAIGSEHGGHDAIHPDLGDEADFEAFVARARELGIEVALDIALQAAPDHPWVSEHPEWFRHRADGSIAYAENPPKKYQDIYPVHFDDDPEGITDEVERILRLWMSRGVRIFRVDNPHTKPVGFWHELLGRIRETDPDVLFLSEAFTRPSMMQGLGKVGFHQSNCYFTWRVSKQELAEYLLEVSRETAKQMRPNFFVNTPDILPFHLQRGGLAIFAIRAVLASMGAPAWGMYAGFELGEHLALAPGKEEYLDSEKFQIRIRDWERHEREGTTLAPLIRRLNEIRSAHPALQQLRNVTIHATDDDQTLAFSKTTLVPGEAGAHDGAPGRDTVLVVVNLDPDHARETTVHLDLPALGVPEGSSGRVEVTDELNGATYVWGEHNYVRLAPQQAVAHIFSVRAL